jgi:sulfotransferase family protein
MTTPEFFVIGAAKSGTTSLHRYLDQHPAISMSSMKEPNFFAFLEGVPAFAGPKSLERSAVLGDRLTREKYGFSIVTWKAYERLFASAAPGALKGESSVSYMYYPHAAERIRRYVPKARFLAILRNPVDRAYSKYLQFRRDGVEPCARFEDAITAEPERIRTRWSPTWFYLDRGYYHRQLSAYVDLFGREHLHVALYDDFARDPQGVLDGMFQFLGVDPVTVDVGRRHNVSRDVRVPRLVWLHDLVMRPNRASRLMRERLPAQLVKAVTPLARCMVFRKAGTLDYTPLSPALRTELTSRFRDDILRLEDLLDRDLSHWLREPA